MAQQRRYGTNYELHAHSVHLNWIYGLRLAAILSGLICLCGGAFMVFQGLEGSFNWAFEVADTLSAKLTNASPGIVFATIGLSIIIYTIKQRPVNFSTSGSDGNHADIKAGGRSRVYSIGPD